MRKDRHIPGKNSEQPVANSNLDETFHYLLRTEEQLLQSISARVPLPELLNSICSALDSQIDNVVSNICLPDDDANEIVSLAGDAAFFGLHAFCSTGVVAENGQSLGSLEMYCSPQRTPSPNESQVIERAACLAAIAIQRHIDAGDMETFLNTENWPTLETVLEWPASLDKWSNAQFLAAISEAKPAKFPSH